MVTVLEALTTRNPEVDNTMSRAGSNTVTYGAFQPAGWHPWQDFNYTTLSEIFKRELRKTYHGSPMPEPVEEDVRIYNEETLQLILGRFVSPVVNYALEEHFGQGHFGLGSRCGRVDIKPDWSLISPEHNHALGDWRTVPVNLVPGDTKLAKKWDPAMVNVPSDFVEWQKVVGQVEKYSASGSWP